MQVHLTSPLTGETLRLETPEPMPFRAPHYTVSWLGLCHPETGEAYLATGGTLFLDQIEEFRRDAIEFLGARLRTMPVPPRVAYSRAYVHPDDDSPSLRAMLNRRMEFARAALGKFLDAEPTTSREARARNA